MEEKIIKWSSKKIIWTILLCLVELAFLLWILSFMMTYPKEAPLGMVALILFVLFLYSSKIKFKPRQRRLAVLKYSLRLVS